jgi:hypothetical protein
VKDEVVRGAKRTGGVSEGTGGTHRVNRGVCVGLDMGISFSHGTIRWCRC